MANKPQILDRWDFWITFYYVHAKTLGIVEYNVPVIGLSKYKENVKI